MFIPDQVGIKTDEHCGTGELIGSVYKRADPPGQKWKSRVRRPTQEELQ